MRAQGSNRGFNGAGMFLSRKLSGSISSTAIATNASMGPGCFYPGNTIPQPLLYIRVWLQWGRDVSIPEIRASPHFLGIPPCFNGAGMFLSRKSREPQMQDASTRCFNGAGMFLSRK